MIDPKEYEARDLNAIAAEREQNKAAQKEALNAAIESAVPNLIQGLRDYTRQKLEKINQLADEYGVTEPKKPGRPSAKSAPLRDFLDCTEEDYNKVLEALKYGQQISKARGTALAAFIISKQSFTKKPIKGRAGYLALQEILGDIGNEGNFNKGYNSAASATPEEIAAIEARLK